MKISERLEKKTEKYLRKHGCEPIHLNEKQWAVVVNEVRKIRHNWLAVITILLSATVLGSISIAKFTRTQARINSLASQDKIVYIVVSENYEEVLEPMSMRNHVDKLAEDSFNVGFFFIVSFMLFVSIAIPLMHNRERKKIVKTFLTPIKGTLNSTKKPYFTLQ